MLDIKIVDDLTQHNLGVLSKHTRHEKIVLHFHGNIYAKDIDDDITNSTILTILTILTRS